MLKQLFISNFTLIDELDITFGQGFSVITGETGAGKSIILGAISLLLGQRADPKTVKRGAKKCVIEAHFDLSKYGLQPFFEQNDMEYDAEDCIIRRELTTSGKSRAFVNDTPTPLSLVKELGEKLIDIHSQHQNLLLGKQDFQMEVVDIIAGDTAELADYQAAYRLLCEKRQALNVLREETERNKANADFIQYQYEELRNAAITESEQEDLERKATAMSHAEDIKSALFEAESLLNSETAGIVNGLKAATAALQSIADMMPKASEMAERMDSVYIEVKDIAHEISSLTDDVEFDPAELQSINNRLDTIYTLMKKHGCTTTSQLLERQEELRLSADRIENGDEAVAQLEAEVAKIECTCHEKAGILTTKRIAAARQVEDEMRKRLVPLGMPNVSFKVEISDQPLGSRGANSVAFLFSANKSTMPHPISQVASGGEIARVMLSLKAIISGAVKLPTIIFDEIDTGVSGKIAEKMAQIMQQMGRNNRQVISITHLPQIAALGQNHYKVFKEETANGTTTTMTPLTEQGRIEEIAQMLSGSNITEAAINNAKELLRQ